MPVASPGGEEAEGEVAVAGAVELDEDDALPGAEDERTEFDGESEAGADEGREDVIGDVRGIVRVPVGEFGHDGLKGVEHVEIGAGIEVGGSEGRGGVQDVEETDAGGARQEGFNLLGNVEDLTFAMRSDGEFVHGR